MSGFECFKQYFGPGSVLFLGLSVFSSYTWVNVIH